MLRRIKLVRWSKQSPVQALKLMALGQGLIWALTATLFFSAALSLWVVVGSHNVYHFSSIVAAGVLVGAFLGGVISGRAAGNQGLLHGAVVGLFYGLVLTLFFAAWSGVTLSLLAMLHKVLLPTMVAALGGVTGVNLKTLTPKQIKYLARMR